MNLLKCSECKKVFSTHYNLRKHIRKFHSEKADILAPKKNYNFQCDVCSRNFNHLRHLKYHKKKHEPNTITPVRKNKKCPLCEYSGPCTKDLITHFSESHNIEMHTSVHTFPSKEHFESWKINMEQGTQSHFIKSRGAVVVNNRQITHYTCHRSGKYVSRSKGLRHLKNQGSNKINGFCPGAIKVVATRSGGCQATFFETHVGHDRDLNHLYLSTEDKEMIANKIADKVPFSEILNEVRGSQLGRIQLLTRKDLHNIKQAYVKQHRLPQSEQYEEEEIFLEYINDSDVEEETTEKESEKDTALTLDAEKERLKTLVNKIIDNVDNFETLESLEKVLRDIFRESPSDAVKEVGADVILPDKNSPVSDHNYARLGDEAHTVEFSIVSDSIV